MTSADHYLDAAPAWTTTHNTWDHTALPPVQSARYSLTDAARQDAIDPDMLEAFWRETLLADFAWQVLWADESAEPDDDSLAEIVCSAEGIVLLLHGWDASGAIWEELPALLLRRNPRLLILAPDINGFGGTPFSIETPPVERCNPPAAMRAIQMWLDLLGLRSAPRTRPVVMVGHSMGGASLFFLDESQWRTGEIGRVACAPALLLNDRQRQNFYKALGAGIQFSALSEVFDRLAENVIAPRVIEVLAGGGSDFVRAEHERIYRTTPDGVVAQTFAAMGLLEMEPDRETWENFVVFLGHRDRLVGLQPTLELLEEFHFDPAQIRVALGDHYFFSLGPQAKLHAKNRALLLDLIVEMHAQMIG